MNQGILYALAAYTLWGFLPIFWKSLHALPAGEILAQRVAWSLLLMVAFLTFKRDWRPVAAAVRTRRTLLATLVATALLTGNWLTYIWGVNAGHILEASLGYFINPLVNVLLGVVFLRERLRLSQWLPIGLAFLGVLYLAFDYGRLPWISLALAFSFALYGLIKKTVRLGSAHGFTLEIGLMFPPALAYLLYLESLGQGAFGHASLSTTLLIILTGVVTVFPMVWFGLGAQRIPLSTLGLLQYIAPTLQFLVGVLVYGEPFTATRAVGFVLIWVALLWFSLEGILVRRRGPRAAPAR